MNAIYQVVVLGVWCCQDFVASVGEGDGTGRLDTVQRRILGYAQKSGCCHISCERCLYASSVMRNGGVPRIAVSGNWVSGRHLCRRIPLKYETR